MSKQDNLCLFLDESIGFLCNCVLPAELNETKVRQVRSEGRVWEGEKKKLRCRSSMFISSSNPVTPPLVTSYSSSSESSSSRHRLCLPQSSTFVHDNSSSTLSLKL